MTPCIFVRRGLRTPSLLSLTTGYSPDMLTSTLPGWWWLRRDHVARLYQKGFMNVIIAASTLICCALGLCLWLLARSAALRTAELPVTTDWIDDLSVERYMPMLRLLAEDDIRSLNEHPGCTPRMVARFRAQRCRAVRGYLRLMQADFGRVCTALKVVMAQSQQDRPDLASSLIRSQITFACGMAAVQFRLLLYRWGLGRVEVAGLVKVFEGLRLQLRAQVPALSPIGA